MTTYTVQSGDTLSAIAKRFLGNANDYMDIFNANRDQLSDPGQDQARSGAEDPAARANRVESLRIEPISPRSAPCRMGRDNDLRHSARPSSWPQIFITTYAHAQDRSGRSR